MPFIGLEECARRLDEKGWDAWNEVSTAFWQECQPIIQESMEIVPVDTGRLRATIPVVSHFVKGETLATAIIGCGTDYGVYVHENMIARHLPPTRAKFIEVPVYHHAPEIPKRIVTRLGMGGYEPADTSGMMTI